MKYIFDLDDTLIQSTALNNDAYNYALEKYGYNRINSTEKITREKLTFIPTTILQKIIIEKQKYFTSKWLPYRIVVNSYLLNIIKQCGRENCYLWTKANKKRVKFIFKYCDFEKLFDGIIFDKKTALKNSIIRLKEKTYSSEFIIYENYTEFFNNKNVKIIDYFKTKNFNIGCYYIHA